MKAEAVSTKQEADRTDTMIRDIPLENICESKTNPRSHFDESAMAELAANVKQHGVLQPVLLRPHPSGESGVYELVAGARRFRASRLARRETIPATIRELTDTQVVEIQLVENLLREDVHELDEASGYAALQQLNPNNYTVETIALKVSRSPAYVHGRLQLLNLVDEAKQAFRTAKLTVSHALERPRPSVCESYAHGFSEKSIWTSRTRRLTRKTKPYCHRREPVLAARSRLAATRSCSRKSHGSHPFARTGNATVLK